MLKLLYCGPLYVFSYPLRIFIGHCPVVADNVKDQYEDNCHWIKEAGHNKLVVGSQARILYSDRDGRIALALAFNKAVADGKLHVSCF